MKIWARIGSKYMLVDWEPNQHEVAEHMIVSALLGTGRRDILEIVAGLRYGLEILCRVEKAYCAAKQTATKLLEDLEEAYRTA